MGDTKTPKVQMNKGKKTCSFDKGSVEFMKKNGWAETGVTERPNNNNKEESK